MSKMNTLESIRSEFKRQMSQLPNVFTVKDFQELTGNYAFGKQMGEAIRSLPFIKNLGKGKYRIRGRRVNG
jgi:hypothetical protein